MRPFGPWLGFDAVHPPQHGCHDQKWDESENERNGDDNG